jgi:hypothetical protein
MPSSEPKNDCHVSKVYQNLDHEIVHIVNREGISDFGFYPIACAPFSKKKMHIRI